MEIETTGKVTVPARIENLWDVHDLGRQAIAAEDVRVIEVPDALVDTGATMLSMPRKLIEQLVLQRTRTRSARTAAGTAQFGIYQAVRLTIQGRDCLAEVAELPDECPVLIGQIPLEALDFVVNPASQKLVGNPDHGGEQMIDLF